ncbi:M17 family peptidase N-terminal domain-containing protein, partial [Cellulomonas sp. P5_C6]
MSVSGGSVATTTLLTDGSTDAVAVPVAPARAGDDALRPLEGTAEAAARYGVDLAEIGERARLTGAAGEIYVLQLPRPVGSSVTLPWAGLPPRLVLVGVGSGQPADLRRAGAALARSSRGLRQVVTTLGAEAYQDASAAATAARAVAEGYLLAAYVLTTLGAEAYQDASAAATAARAVAEGYLLAAYV